MPDSYEREGFAGLLGGHEIKKAAHGGAAPLAAFSDPVDRQTDHDAAHHGQIEGGDAMAHPAAIFPGDDVQAQMQPRFDAPVTPVGGQHVPGVQRGRWARAEQILGLDFSGRMLVTVNATGQPGRLFGKGENDGGGRGGEGLEAARLGAPAIAFTGLDQRRRDLRGKNRATDLGRVVARFPGRLFGSP